MIHKMDNCSCYGQRSCVDNTWTNCVKKIQLNSLRLKLNQEFTGENMVELMGFEPTTS